MVDQGAGPHSELPSERVAGGMLPKVLNSFDMVAIFVSIVLFITNAAVVQGAGRRPSAGALSQRTGHAARVPSQTGGAVLP